MSAEDKPVTEIVAYGTLEKETKNQVRYATSLGVVYVPKAQLEKLSGTEGKFPNNIKITIVQQEG